MLRITKVLLIFAVALWGYLGAMHNLLDWPGTLGAVGAVISMATIEDGAQSWQAISSPLLAWLGALFICLSKLTAAVLCTGGAIGMWRARNGAAVNFAQAKAPALAGCGIAMFMLFGGFVVVADGFFELWRSEAMSAPVLGSAFRYGAMIMLIGIFVGATDD